MAILRPQKPQGALQGVPKENPAVSEKNPTVTPKEKVQRTPEGYPVTGKKVGEQVQGALSGIGNWFNKQQQDPSQEGF